MDFTNTTMLLIALVASWAFNVSLLYIMMKMEERVEFLEDWAVIEYELLLEADDENDE